MQKDNKTSDPHEGFFRLRDHLSLDFHRPDTAELGAPGSAQSPLFSLLGELHLLDQESQHLLRQIGERDRALAGYLKILNKRIDLLGHSLAAQLTSELEPPTEVILSEGGLTFSATEPLEPDSRIVLKMVLLPSPIGLQTQARVTSCESLAASGIWSIQVSFEQLDDGQRQLLARHILQKQAQEIRAAKSNERTSI